MGADVLIVDDSELMRGMLREIVSDRFTVVDEAENGKEAVEKVLAASPTVVLMDMVMPEVDGVEATGVIKRRKPEIQIVFCTSVDQQSRMRDAIDAGADGYVLKPFEEEMIVEAIEDVI
ncbi:response regulator [Natrialbaceae archaeon GCM10025810]|uniref:response regulator n=1 Tax=Halovalidus salilacus TaxID=3075124 RepID=UPI003619E0DB